ncbi:MAG: virulence protein RhuM/Fic/DOC family protein [Candidatus Paceibacterota bacterium]|jgi:prophage maintenance system killer protein
MVQKKDQEIRKGEVAIYKSKSGPYLDVRLEKETVWLTQKQMAGLFDKDVKTINEHIKNIYKEEELKEKATVRNFRIVQKEGARTVERNVDFYNLDVIISVGYRIKSLSGTQFRIWATKVLRNHLLEGYTINEQRLSQAENKFKKLQEAVSFLRKKSENKLLLGQGREILNLLADYSKTLILLSQYDKEKLTLVKKAKSRFILDYWKAREVISEVKRDLAVKGEESDLFGQENGGRLKSVIENIYRTSGGEELYQSLEEKAAHLLYSAIKDLPFADGNKRIASFLFVYFLDRNKNLYKRNGERKIDDNSLTALSLLIAASEPKEKDKIIKIITNLLAA